VERDGVVLAYGHAGLASGARSGRASAAAQAFRRWAAARRRTDGKPSDRPGKRGPVLVGVINERYTSANYSGDPQLEMVKPKGAKVIWRAKKKGDETFVYPPAAGGYKVLPDPDGNGHQRDDGSASNLTMISTGYGCRFKK